MEELFINISLVVLSLLTGMVIRKLYRQRRKK